MSPPTIVGEAWLRQRHLVDGVDVEDLAAELGVHVSSIWRAFRRYGIEWRRQRARIVDEERLWRRYVDDGAPAAVIAREMGASRSGVQYALRRAGIDREDRGTGTGTVAGRRGRSVPVAPLADQVRLAGLSGPEAAALAGIARRSWYRCLRNGSIAVAAADRLVVALGLHPALLWPEDPSGGG